MPAPKKEGSAPKGHSHRNPILTPGLHRFGRSAMFHKKGLWVKKSIKNKSKDAQKKPLVVEKPVGGEKNGGKRLVQLKKSKRYHPTAEAKKRRVIKRTGVIRKTKLRGSLTPGTVLILVAGRHAGKRVVLLKQLASGLLLVTGPFKLNSVPMRRVNQRYVIATSTKLNLSKVKLPENLNDVYFRRNKKAARKARREQIGDIFASSKPQYVVSDQRKEDQATVDKAILTVIKAHADKKTLQKYLSAPFSLRSGQYPHKMKF